MQVYRHLLRFSSSKNIPKFRVGQILALRVRVDDDGMHPQLSHAPFNLFGRSCRVLRCDGNHPCKTRWMSTHSIGELVICKFAERYGRCFVHHLHARRSQRNHLVVNARLVHVLQPHLV